MTWTARERRIDIYLLALTAGLHRALAVGIVPVVGHESIVVWRQQAVLLVPAQFALVRAGLVMPIVRQASDIHLYKTSVFIIQIYVIVLNFIFSWSLLRAIVNVRHIGQLEFLPLIRPVGVWQVVAYVERTVEL